MHVSAAFDAGNVEVVDASRHDDVRLRIRKDNASDFYQWFSFRVVGARGLPCAFTLENAGGAAYPPAWEGYEACASYDRQTWFRVPTVYEQGALTFRLVPERDAVWFAYFAPYPMERHRDLVARSALSPRATVSVIGTTLDGQDLDLVRVGTPAEHRRRIFVIARQHPGESMAEWWMEGFLGRLLDEDDALARQLLERACLWVVPNMNPDGSARGNLRTNAVGANLNREWEAPSRERSPEVLAVRDLMDEIGVDLCLDVHGDEELPYNFIAGPEGIPGYTDRLRELLGRFTVSYERANPDFQRVHGYPPDAPGQANMTMCTSQIAQRFDCLAMTLEMPFKDNAFAPDPRHGWSPARSRRLGASAVDPLAEIAPALR